MEIFTSENALCESIVYVNVVRTVQYGVWGSRFFHCQFYDNSLFGASNEKLCPALHSSIVHSMTTSTPFVQQAIKFSADKRVKG
ncbi:hypothetical protein RJT34_17964 [Clitoria ternatea]|uniref:Uncharacterized protein n=1 Tax=Clitoria ternatea TaxID=43366 RepID=A0AAN9JB80_CLITE